MAVYFIGRNYFFLSVSSVIMSIRWKKSVFILLKNCIYLALIIILFLAEKLIIKLLAGLAINCYLIFMMIKGKWFLNKLFKIECYATGAVPCHKSSVNGRVFIKHSRFLVQLNTTRVELVIPALLCQKFIVVSALNDCSFFQYDYFRCVSYGA